MPKRIYEIAKAKSAAISKNASEAGQNAQLAVAAIIGGIKSPAWRSYMLQFIEQNPPGVPVEPAQLERLLGTDGTLGVAQLDRHRAYLVANAVCASETRLTTTFTIDTIDNTLPSVGVLEEPNEPYALSPRRRPRKAGKKKAGKKRGG